MHLACGRGQEDAALLLLEAGGRWSVTDKHGATPLDWAIKGSFMDEARRLDSRYEVGWCAIGGRHTPFSVTVGARWHYRWCTLVCPRRC